MVKVCDLFDFEIDNHLFDIKDKNGLRPWEAVRYYVMMNLLYNTSTDCTSENQIRKDYNRILRILCSLFRFGKYFIKHRNTDVLFMLCTRDRKGNQYFDKVSEGIYSVVNKKLCFTIETTNNNYQINYKYGKDIAPYIVGFFSKICRASYDYSEIYKLLKENFPSITISKESMNDYYRQFVGEYKFYRCFLSLTHFKKIVLVQNGIRKGFFAAANECGIKVYELQHGQISYNHPAYSYPDESRLSASKIYHPDYLLTLGPFWIKNRFYPGVEDIVIGNDYYSEKQDVDDVAGNKKLIVISNNLEGELLAKRVEEVIEKDPEFFFYFKLHPNQYEEYDYYKRRFEKNSSVEVVSNQQTINQLLAKCEGIFLNQSTVELEALRLGRKVFILKEQNYRAMDYVFDEKGVYACDNVDAFLEEYEIHKNEKLQTRNDLFSSFDVNKAKELLEICR